MRLDVQHFRTRIGRRIVLLFLACVLGPTIAVSGLSYWQARSQLRASDEDAIESRANNAQWAAMERIQSVESELILLAASPPVESALRGTDGPTSEIESLRRLDAVTLATPDATISLYGELSDLPELPNETLGDLDRGESALVVARSGGAPSVLMARAAGSGTTEQGVLWARIIPDSLWATAQVYAVDMTAEAIDLQDARGYCVVDGSGQPLNCAGALVTWILGGVPEDIRFVGLRGDHRWSANGRSYTGHHRLLPLASYNTADWNIVVANDDQGLLEPLAEFRNMLLAFIVFGAALAVLIGAYQIRHYMEPLAKLREGTRRVAAQDFSTRVKIASGDEFEELAGSFNNMAHQVGSLFEELKDLNWSTITTLARTIDAKSPWTAGHSERVSQMSVAIARVMGLSEAEIERLYRGGLLHDIGKIGVPITIIDKQARLTDEEMAIMRSHVTIGAKILEPLTALEDVIPIVLYHHERYDGKGYEAGLGGTDIPLLARILCVADSYDAMRSDRPYRAGRAPDETLEEVAMCAGTQFDPVAVEAFVEYMSSEEGELAAMGKFSKPFGVAAEARVKSSRSLAESEKVTA